MSDRVICAAVTILVAGLSAGSAVGAEPVVYVGQYTGPSGTVGVYGKDYSYQLGGSVGANWYTSGYDHTSWLVGDTPFGNTLGMGNWSWSSPASDWSGGHAYVYREFYLNQPVDMTAYFSVDNEYEMWVNGSYFSDGRGEGNPYHWEYVQPVSSSRLHSGMNSIAFKLTDWGGGAGWDFALVGASSGLVYTTPVTRTPPSGQTTVRASSSSQLQVLSAAGVADPSKPTIVLTHGWNSSPGGAFGETVANLQSAGIDANILAWNWQEDAGTGINLQKAASRAPRQGDALGEAIVLTLGQDYDQTIHFVGHSLGARVNKQAVDTIHLNGLDWTNTQVSILDAAELGDLDRMPWEKSIPEHAAWIDNYISAFGSLHPEAANVILREGMPISIDPSAVSLYEALEEFHGYPVDWYAETIYRPHDSAMGYQWSFEGDGLNGSPSPGSTFVQTLNPFDDELAVESVTWSTARSIVSGRNTLYTAQGGLLALNAIREGAVETVGEVTTDIVEKVRDDTIEQVLQLVLHENSPAYAWVPITVPDDAHMISFEFLFSGVGDEDFLSFGIEDDAMFAIEGAYITPDALMSSGLIDVSAYAGQDVDLFFGLNSDGVAGGVMTIEGIEFYSVPEPAALTVMVLGCVVLLRHRKVE